MDYSSDSDFEADEKHADEMAAFAREWEESEAQEELRWLLYEVWQKTLPDGRTLLKWESSRLKYVDVFDTRTLFREFGIRGFGNLRVHQEDWRQLLESAHQYCNMYNLSLEPIVCEMAQWYLKP